MQTSPIVFSAYQNAFFQFVEKGKGNAILEAVAGSGKTTTIVESARRMKGWVMLLAYNTKMGNELKERIAGLTNVRAGTFHSAGFAALRFNLKQFKLQLDDKKVYKIAQAIVDNGRKDLENLVGPVADIVSMAKQRGIGALVSEHDEFEWMDMIDHFGLYENIPEDVDLNKVIKFAQVVLKRSNTDLNTIDYNDMIYIVLQRNLRTLQSDWVLIDEAQDTNPTRRALAKKLLKPGGRLVAVGDPAQAIFGFTGADNDALEQIARDFKCQKLPLTVTYRCPKAVVRHAKTWVSHIEAADTAPEGEVLSMPYENVMAEAKVGDAVLCRYNKYLVNLCFKFIRAGVPAKMEGRNIGEGLVKLSQRWKVKTLETLEKRLETYLEREVAKWMAKDKEMQADAVKDRVETLMVLIDRAREQNIHTVAELTKMIMELFEDNAGSRKPCVVLSSAHRSKGLEWNRVFLLGREEFMPSVMARRPWQMEQENNLIYVAVTRAKQTLIEVTGVRDSNKTEKEQKKEEQEAA